MSFSTDLAEHGLIPDALIRQGIRRLLAGRERGMRPDDEDRHVQRLAAAPVAIDQDAANEQHYRVPPAFFLATLGPHLKYSSCFYATPSVPLGDAEAAMLDLTCQRAGLADGQDILELGCGWGSLTLFMAARYPAARIRAVSNSPEQRGFILARAAERGLANIEVVTADLVGWDAGATYDRVVSVECFEHIRNWGELFRRISTWLRPDGRLFFHVFCHVSSPYTFDLDGDNDWMARHFFTGGQMPSLNQPRRFASHLQVEEQWSVPGTHYGWTSRDWLANLDRHRDRAERALADGGCPRGQLARQIRRWRLFFLACEETFAYQNGSRWLVGHYRLRKNAA